ncbi:14564_t:CDS:1, partial [Acaulospora colombiana]
SIQEATNHIHKMIIQEAAEHIYEIKVIDSHIRGMIIQVIDDHIRRVIKVIIIDIGEMGLDINEIQITKNLNMVVEVNVFNLY